MLQRIISAANLAAELAAQKHNPVEKSVKKVCRRILKSNRCKIPCKSTIAPLSAAKSVEIFLAQRLRAKSGGLRVHTAAKSGEKYQRI